MDFVHEALELCIARIALLDRVGVSLAE
jgi:hypothetical protein